MKVKKKRLTPEQQELVEKHAYLAHIIAHKVKKKYPLTYDEIHSACLRGLCEAAMSFKPKKGIKFRTYANYRMRGAVKDYIRQINGRYGQKELTYVGVVECEGRENGKTLDTYVEDFEEGYFRIDFWDQVSKPLTSRSKEIIWKYYFEQLTMKEIGYELGICESRVSQVLKHALKVIQTYFENREEGIEDVYSGFCRREQFVQQLPETETRKTGLRYLV